MKFLVDNQLPAALAQFLISHGHNCQHVLDLGMDEANDIQIWNHAVKNGQILITKDEDFFYFANRKGPTPPLVWVRLGNCRNATLLGAFKAALPKLLAALQAGDKVVEIR